MAVIAARGSGGGSGGGSQEGVDLPECTYRATHDGTDFRCGAAAQAIVSADDCRACSIPAAVKHKDACLYLTPLRHDGKACYACRWFFSSAREAVVDDWRKLCFCTYWFPRGPDERHVLELTAARQMHYLKVLRGEAPRRTPRVVLAPADRARNPPRRRSLQAWLLTLWHRLTSRTLHRRSAR